jgi:hypothetical protein
VRSGLMRQQMGAWYTVSSTHATVTNAINVWFQVLATREGLVGQQTACGTTILPDGHFVALPAGGLCGTSVNLRFGSTTTAGNPCVGPADRCWNTTGVPRAASDSCSNGAGIETSTLRSSGMTSKPRNTTQALLRLAALLLIASAKSLSGSIEAEIEQHVPTGAVVARLPQHDTGGEVKKVAVAASGPIARSVSEDIAFVYERAGSLTLRVVTRTPASTAEYDATLPGTFVSNPAAIPMGISLQSVTGRGGRLIFVCTSDGASSGLYLTVLSLEPDGLANAVRGDMIGGHDFKFEHEARRQFRIVSYGKWTDRASSWVRVHEWLGTVFVETGKDAKEHFLKRLSDLAASATADVPMPAPFRTHLATLAVNLYLGENDSARAIQLCEAVLERLTDPLKARARNTGATEPQRSVELQLDLRTSAAELHDMLAQSYDAVGRHAEADRERRISKQLAAGSTTP